MKLEIRNHFDNEYAEMKGKVSKTKPVMGILIGEAEVNGRKSRKVLSVIAAKNIKEMIKEMKIKESDVTEFVDLR